MKHQIVTMGFPYELSIRLTRKLADSNGKISAATTRKKVIQISTKQATHLIALCFSDLGDCAGFAAELRKISFAPIVIFADSFDPKQACAVLEAGADLCLPSSQPAELLAEYAASQYRRYTAYNNYEMPQEQKSGPFTEGDIRIDPLRRIVQVQGKEINLRPREFSLLLYFMRNPGVVLTAEQICESAWGMEGSYNRGISQPIRLLRQAIEPNPDKPIYIETVRRVGYRFTAHNSETCDEC